MRSPFPGMDPYLESKWPEVHASLIVYARNQINGQLPSDLQANIEENLSVYSEHDEPRSIRPDVNIGDEIESSPATGAPSQIAVAEPLRLKRAPYPDRHIEIVNSNGRVITAIEFLSPWNKIGMNNREKYVRKQLDYLDAGVNLVEIDLISRGEYVLAAPFETWMELFPERRTPYAASVSRMIDSDEVELYPIAIQEQLPNIPIPLRPYESDVVLQLQALLDDAYRDGRYHRIDYNIQPIATFDDSTFGWIDQRLKDAGARSA